MKNLQQQTELNSDEFKQFKQDTIYMAIAVFAVAIFLFTIKNLSYGVFRKTRRNA